MEDNTEDKSKTQRLATIFNLAPAAIERAVKKEFPSKNINDAYLSYRDFIGNDEEMPKRAKELRRWIKFKLENAVLGDYLEIHLQTPDEFVEALEVDATWDKAVQDEISKERQSPWSAKEAHTLLRQARPRSKEYFLAVEIHEEAFSRDFRKAKEQKDIPLLFELAEITRRGACRTEIERLLCEYCTTDDDLVKLRLIASDIPREHQAIVKAGQENDLL